MKKTYIIPEMETIELKTMGMLAASQTAPLDEGTQNNDAALARELMFLDF